MNLKIEYKNVDEIIPYENNPRHNEDTIPYVMKSIKEFGFKNPIIIDKNNIVIAGHTRLEAAKRLNLKEVPTINANDLTPEQVKAFRLADNKIAEQSTWDFDLLESELEDIDMDMEDFGFIKEEDLDLDGFFEDTPEKEKKEETIVCPYCGEEFTK